MIMFAKQEMINQPGTILAVCLQEVFSEIATDPWCVLQAQSGREALKVMRMKQIDLLLAGLHLSDMSVWELIGKVRMLWPWQKWVLIADDLTEQDECVARRLGATGIFGTRLREMPEFFRLACRIRAGALEATVAE